MRAGLPEPKAFLNHCRNERDTTNKAAMVEGARASIHTAPSSKRWVQPGQLQRPQHER